MHERHTRHKSVGRQQRPRAQRQRAPRRVAQHRGTQPQRRAPSRHLGPPHTPTRAHALAQHAIAYARAPTACAATLPTCGPARCTRGLARGQRRRGDEAAGSVGRLSPHVLWCRSGGRSERACAAHETQEQPQRRRRWWPQRPAAARTKARRAAQRHAASASSTAPFGATSRHHARMRSSGRHRPLTRCHVLHALPPCHPLPAAAPHYTRTRARSRAGQERTFRGSGRVGRRSTHVLQRRSGGRGERA